MKRINLLKESILATLLVLIITFGVSFIPFKFEFTKAIRQGFLGFDIYDLKYSGKHLRNTQRDTDIIIVQIGNDRLTIAGQILAIQKYSPAVLAVDAVFEKEREASDDFKLHQAISQSGNMVFASRYDNDPLTGQPAFVYNFFGEKDDRFQSGYINILGSQFSVIRNYPPFLKEGDSVYLAFTSVIIKKYSAEKFNKLKKRNRKLEVINYTGNVESYTCLSQERLEQYDTTGQLKSLIAGKIVLLGYFDKDPPLVMEDMHFSPLNEQIAGKSFPDMYGVVIHANILSMILKDKYMIEASGLVSYLFAGLITFLFLFFILSRHKKNKPVKHPWLLLIQFLLILLILYIFLQVFDLFQVKVPLLPIMIAVVLSVELFGLYKWIAHWLNKKYHYKTVFTNKKTL